MEIIEAIKTRRSVRGFTGENVTDEAVTRILEAGRWAPSGLNNQPWRFIIVRNPETMVEMVNKSLDAPDSYELMAVIAIGYPVSKQRIPERKDLDQLVFREKFGKDW